MRPVVPDKNLTNFQPLCNPFALDSAEVSKPNGFDTKFTISIFRAVAGVTTLDYPPSSKIARHWSDDEVRF